MTSGRKGDRYDVAVVGIGIVGMAHALAAARTGARVILIDAQQRNVGASIRNFGFVTVTGQERHQMWPLARRSRDVWQEAAQGARIGIDQTGLIMTARRPQSVAVIEEFMQTEMAEGCTMMSGAALRAAHPAVPFGNVSAALVSSHELRVEARTAIPALLGWLQSRWGVDFKSAASVTGIDPGCVRTSAGDVRADVIFACPGNDVAMLYPELAAQMGVQPCKLQMLRLGAPGFRLPSPVMSDLGLARYEGYAALSSAALLKAQLALEQPRLLAAGVHLIAVQSADGSLVVGDSHEYGGSPDPFLHSEIDDLILSEYRDVLGATPPVIERWAGVYAWSNQQNWFSRQVDPGVHVTVVTCGAGMSTSFAIAEQVVAGALQSSPEGIA